MCYRVYRGLTGTVERMPGVAPLFTHLRLKRVRKRLIAAGFESDACMWNWKGDLGTATRNPCCWFHAASLGEALSILPIVKASAAHLDCPIHFTFSSASALAVIPSEVAAFKTSRNVVYCHLLPLDFPGEVEQFLEKLNPKVGVFVESELWPNLIQEAVHRNVKLVLVNAHLSERSWKLWLSKAFLRQLLKQLLGSFDSIYCKTEGDYNRISTLSLSSQVRYEGDMKEEAQVADPQTETHLVQSIPNSTYIWIAGSTHDGEEAVMFDVHRKLQQTIGPDLITIVAPRHPERSKAIQTFLRNKGGQVHLRSDLKDSMQNGLFILDSLGELRSLYNYVNVAFIGGSLSSFGGKVGHNLWEAINADVGMVITGKLGSQKLEEHPRTQAADTVEAISAIVKEYITPRKNPKVVAMHETEGRTQLMVRKFLQEQFMSVENEYKR